MGKVFIVDQSKCNGCYSCQIACKDEHCANDWPPYALPQPTTGQYWLRLDEREHGSIPRIKVEYTPVPCMHCNNAPCMAAAPEAVYRRADGIVIIDPTKAKGLKRLVESCPYGAIYYNQELDIPQKCTGCAHLLDAGKLPHCVDLCATGGIRFGEEEDFIAEIAVAEVLLPEAGTLPRVYYLNRPQLFIAGAVYDPVDDEVIIGATITLVNSEGYKSISQSDDFGVFWFKQLLAGEYRLDIQAKGFEPLSLDVQCNDSMNLGDFALEAAS